MKSFGRASGWGLLLAGLGLFCACETADDPFPSQGALSAEVTYSGLGTQSAPPPAPQIVIWTIEEISASEITGFEGDFAILRTAPCFYPLNVVALLALNRACPVSGLTLAPGVERTAVLTFRISAMELRQAARPDLRIGADPDGDGVPNGDDNCPIIPNVDQEDVNGDNVGDACSKLDESTTPAPVVPDFDRDDIANVLDKCLWYYDPLPEGETAQPDADRDSIGDACERIAPVILPSGGLEVACPVEFTTRPSVASTFRLDFAREGVLTCDAGFTGCSIDGNQLVASLVGTTETFPCEVVSGP